MSRERNNIAKKKANDLKNTLFPLTFYQSMVLLEKKKTFIIKKKKLWIGVGYTVMTIMVELFFIMVKSV